MHTSSDGHKLWQLFAFFSFFNLILNPLLFFRRFFVFFLDVFQSPVCCVQFFDQWLLHCRALSKKQQTW